MFTANFSNPNRIRFLPQKMLSNLAQRGGAPRPGYTPRLADHGWVS